MACRATRRLSLKRGGSYSRSASVSIFRLDFSLTPRSASFPSAILRTIFRTDEPSRSRGLDPLNSPINLRRRRYRNAIRRLKMADSSRRSSLFSAELIRSIGRNSSSIVELAPASALSPALPRALSRADSVTIYNESSSHFEGTALDPVETGRDREGERETWCSLHPRLRPRPPPVSFLLPRTPLKCQEFHVSSRLKDTRNTVPFTYIKKYPSRRISEHRHLKDPSSFNNALLADDKSTREGKAKCR